MTIKEALEMIFSVSQDSIINSALTLDDLDNGKRKKYEEALDVVSDFIINPNNKDRAINEIDELKKENEELRIRAQNAEILLRNMLKE